MTNSPPPRRAGTFSAGTYLRCLECGRMLKIEWATRSIVCACGARVTPPPRDDEKPPPRKQK
ncbi:MAG: hypothetical protein MUF51_04165 [Vicinamibacteria bacterium]|jgi:DNA-directed RNA polymerase subunit RPC12/RpoP|nr:hypothetical protein [Vicinamibacteria bacterium]